MSLLPSISAIIRGFLDNKLKEIIQERDKIKDDLLKPELENKEKID